MLKPITSSQNERYSSSTTAQEIISNYSFIAQDWFKGAKKPQESQNQSIVQYQLDNSGILVYDSHAKMCFSHNDSMKITGPLPPRHISLLIQRELDEYYDKDRQTFMNLCDFSQTKPKIEDRILMAPSSVLKFESNFESGNLSKALKMNENEYNLYLEYDVNTQGHTQWYYFSVRTFKENHTVRFNIVNLLKYESLYNEGLKPLVFSLKDAEITGVTWKRGGFNISYYQNSIPIQNAEFHYTLTFTYTFAHANDLIYFSHSYPYTYTDLNKDLEAIKAKHSDKCRIDTLCMTLANNPCPVLTITHNVGSFTPWEEELTKITKTAAGRRLIRIKEIRKGGRKRALQEERSCTHRKSPPRRKRRLIHA
ncbi:unnamed protein product [Blepharisma stoltei]|uniref:Cytosolic carboxypeptidase N-terminal domain-containing protein n=1 Tax=Blepharisma stoltei TaxID=1481888 RepID=A0AAU9IQL5_9CILI|nr:unnamed protein product [Blepharisma stoltei]